MERLLLTPKRCRPADGASHGQDEGHGDAARRREWYFRVERQGTVPAW